MKPIDVSPALLRNTMLAILLALPNLQAADTLMNAHGSPQTVAFARHVAAEERDALGAQPGLALVAIEASLPGLYKQATVLFVRKPGNQGPNYLLLGADGDGAVVEEVVARYLMLEREMEKRPEPSVAITPVNYKFHFAGEVRTGESTAYIYRISPRKRRPGLVAGKIWIDSESGTELTLSGRLKNAPFLSSPAELVRETRLENGSAYARVTHLAFTLPQLGRAELVVTERFLPIEQAIPGVHSY